MLRSIAAVVFAALASGAYGRPVHLGSRSRVGWLGLTFALVGWATLPQAGVGQQGFLVGRVTNESGAAVVSAQVDVLGAAQAVSVLTNAQGQYRIQLAAGSYDLVVTSVGSRPSRFDDVTVASGQTTTFDLILPTQAEELNPIQVTVSRGTVERETETVATVHNVSSAEIVERPAQSLSEHLRAAPGVDVVTQGVQATNVVVRGFNNIFSGALHMLTDHRLAGVPSLRVNLMHFIPANDLDVDRMEVVLGPGSALYGPNTANGVVHILTKSPLDDQGTTLTLGGGERSVFQGSFRSAWAPREDFGFKISGQYLRGDEWEYRDTAEVAAQNQALTNRPACLADKAIRGLSGPEAQAACDRVAAGRDYGIERYGLEARADWRFAEDGTVVTTYGRSDATGIELTGLGAGRTIDWVTEFYQARVNKGRLFGQLYLNTSDAGGSYLLLSGLPLVDESSLFVGQLQHGFALADGRQEFTYGFDYFATRPDTRGTINGMYEDDDEMDEWGVYLQSKTALSPRLDLVAAGRVDDHSVLPDAVWSPRAALVFRPRESQSVRLSYNRAFSTPSSLNYFLDISGGAAPPPVGALGYGTRAFGSGRSGWSLMPDGVLRMRSPFNPGGADQLLPATPSVMWPLAVGVLQGSGQITPQTAAFLASLTPSGSALGVMLLDPTTQALTPAAGVTLPGVPPIEESYTETFEVGWTGILANRAKISADLFYMKKNAFVSPLLVQTPLLTLNGQSIASFITAPWIANRTQQLVNQGMDATAAQAQAQAEAAVVVPQLAAGLAQIPVGVVSSSEVGAQGAEFIATYRNVGDLSLWGADFGLQWFLTDRWALSASYSHMSDHYFEIDDGDPIALNAPKDKGTVGLAYRDVDSGLNGSARVRFSGEFPAESAVYVGTTCVTGNAPTGFEEGCVEASAIVDLSLGYRIPDTAATIQVMVNNVLDSGYRSFIGVPETGRFAMVRVRYDLF